MRSGLRVDLAIPFLLVGSLSAGCIDEKSAKKAVEAIQTGGPKPDVLPVQKNSEPPFHYPASLFDRKVQGNVTLRIYIDSIGGVHPESTIVVESSGYPALDSAAVTGSRELSFVPARLHDKPMGTSILLPVFFRYPGAPPLPGDTILHRPPKSGTGRP
ncbi:MAG: energy transducer TonB family protein [Gemmatimonadaceae bacterium]